MTLTRLLIFATAMISAPLLAAGYDPAPWLADLAQVRTALATKYANGDWLRDGQGVDVDALVAETAERVRSAGNDAGARAAFDRLVRHVADGHVEIAWPTSVPPGPTGSNPSICATLGYDARQSAQGASALLPGYRPVLGGGNVFPTGTVDVDGRRLGIVRIAVFQPQGSPQLCDAALAALAIPGEHPCTGKCEDAVLTWSYRRFTADFEERLRQLKTAGATVLLVDISNNGGGSEWAEAAARMLSREMLTSARLGFVRGPHWTKHWAELASQLREAAKEPVPDDRRRLLGWVSEAEAARRDAQAPCVKPKGCGRIGYVGFATGLVGAAHAGDFAGKPWGPLVFSPAQYDYRDGIWDRAVIVLVDQETWSAAEEFAAMLQDNQVATVLGTRTGGAGCGHTDGGTPTLLEHSGATLQLPDCLRLRRDGSNEVAGIIPDRLIATRFADGPRFKAALIAKELPATIRQAIALNRQ